MAVERRLVLLHLPKMDVVDISDAGDTALAGWTPLGNYELQRRRDRLPLARLMQGDGA